MIRNFNLLRYVRRYQWILGIAVLLVALFVLSSPPVPKDLNYRYQLNQPVAGYPLVRQTAALVEWSTERIREVYRWNLAAETVSRTLPRDNTGTDGATMMATMFILLGVAAMAMIWFVPAHRGTGVGLVLLILAGSHLGAHPAAYSRFMSWPSTAVPNAAVTLVVHAEPGHSLGIEREARAGLKDMADRYFNHYVKFTEKRMASAGRMFAGPKRIWFGVSGLVYVLPFAILLAVLAALTTLTQTLSWALLVAAPFGIALALIDGRAGLKVWNHVLGPLIGTLVILAVLGVILPLALFTATAVHAIETEVGLLLVGSVFPLMLLLGALFLFRRKGGDRDADGRRRAPLGLGRHNRTKVFGATSRTVRLLRPRSRRARQ